MICHYPISIITYERPEYLTATLQSLRRSGVKRELVHIFDDCSSDPAKKNLLANLGASGYNVYINNVRLGTYVNTRNAIQHVYNNYDSDYLIYLQDDIKVSKTWYYECCKIMDKFVSDNKNAGILSMYHWKGDDKGLYNILEAGHPGGPAWMINRKFWEAYTAKYDLKKMEQLLSVNDKTKERYKAHISDWKICHCAHLMNWLVAYTGKSYIQHMGDKSSLGSRNMKPYRGKDIVYV